MKLPQLTFFCNSLTILKLCFKSTYSITLGFPSLKHLFLCNCQFWVWTEKLSSIHFKTVLIWNIYIFVVCHYFGEINMFKIFDPHLTYLNISRLIMDEKFDADCVIELEYFKYCDSNLYYFSSEINLSLLEEIDSQFVFTIQKLYVQILS